MEFIKWLKRIFSVGTVSLIVGLVSLLIAYLAFVRDSPGQLDLYSNTTKIHKDVSNVFLFLDASNGKVTFLDDAIETPYLANSSQRDVNDCSLLFQIQNQYPIEVQHGYMFKTDTVSNVLSTEIIAKEDRIGYMTTVLFPITDLYTSKSEPLIIPSSWTYIHKGMKESKIYKIYFVTIPSSHLSKELREEAFIKEIRPYLLSLDNKTVVIIYDKMILERPRNTKILRSEDISGITLDDLR